MKHVFLLAFLITIPFAQAENTLSGAWLNVDTKSAGITRFLIRQTGSGMTITTYAKCKPIDCTWGESALTSTGIDSYSFGYVNDRGTFNFAATQVDSKTLNIKLSKTTAADLNNPTVENITATKVESGPNVYIELR